MTSCLLQNSSDVSAIKTWSYSEIGAGCLISTCPVPFSFGLATCPTPLHCLPSSLALLMFLKGQHNKERLVSDKHEEKKDKT